MSEVSHIDTVLMQNLERRFTNFQFFSLVESLVYSILHEMGDGPENLNFFNLSYDEKSVVSFLNFQFSYLNLQKIFYPRPNLQNVTLVPSSLIYIFQNI